MKINIYDDTEGIRHIAVNGEVYYQDEVNELLGLLCKQSAKGLTITFFEANMLHKDIVERLYQIAERTYCKVYVFRMYLYIYLHKVGIKCEYISSGYLEIKKDEESSEYEFSLEEVRGFLEKVYERYGYDYTNYDMASIMRRINVCMIKENSRAFSVFCQDVLRDPSVFEHLFQDLSINTTEFFRNPEVFLTLRNKILPYLNSYMHIKIWCAGCSSGQEAYSVAILLDELDMLHKAQIYATDINPYVIEEAKNGLYGIDTSKETIANYQMAGGTKCVTDYFDMKRDYFKVKDYLSKNVLFFQHSLTESGSLNEFEMILCRNVLIYFNHDLQGRVLQNFYQSLDRNGFLVLGKAESLLLNSGDKYFLPYIKNEKIYKIKN